MKLYQWRRSLLFTFVLAAFFTSTACNMDSPKDPQDFIQLVTILAAGDSFQMGDDDGAGPDPVLTQTISYNFQMSKYEITNAQFQAFVVDSGYGTDSYWTTNGITARNSNSWSQPNYWMDSDYNGSNQPVVGVSWYEAVAFCNWLSVKEGFTAAYDSNGLATLTASGYRLPTEVEWEYAAAKGASGQTERIYAWGDVEPVDCTLVAGNLGGCGNDRSEDVGSKSPAGDTPQGLADMSGNAREWCSDNNQLNANVVSGTDRYYFVNDLNIDFIIRGGSWDYSSQNELIYRGAKRDYVNNDERGDGQGFRVVRPIP